MEKKLIENEEELEKVTDGADKEYAGTENENLEAAQSVFRDADEAKKATEIAKKQVLMQAATASLVQLNPIRKILQ